MEWVKKGLAEKFWDPIKEVTRNKSPQVVALKPRKNGRAVSGGSAVEVYAEFLEKSNGGGGKRVGLRPRRRGGAKRR